ncbi:TrkA family potassium uptake protein [candidate division KSB1 bacterium]|nr:TrkA family potassium uptake protein [candidate division KSB1 bacterium]
MRSFAIIGLSSFGHYLASYLSDFGHRVLAVDINEDKIEKIKSNVDRAVIADATDKKVLDELGLSDMDIVVVSLGDQIDASILVTLYLRELKVKQILAKALTEDHGKILDIIGATRVVFPERDEALRLAKTLENDYLLDNISLGEGISIIEIAPPQDFIGKTLGELDLRNRLGVLVLVVKEMIPENVVMIPTAEHMIKDSDVLVLLGKDRDLARINKLK